MAPYALQRVHINIHEQEPRILVFANYLCPESLHLFHHIFPPPPLYLMTYVAYAWSQIRASSTWEVQSVLSAVYNLRTSTERA